jgi:hypothetical protein
MQVGTYWAGFVGPWMQGFMLSKNESQMKVNPQLQSTAFSHLLVTSQLLVHESQV